MPLITWGPQLEIGVDIIDKQHQGWVNLLNELDVALVEGRGLEQVGKTLNELVDYTHAHFRTEEGLMAKHGYEDLPMHRREHRVFTDQIEIFRDRVELGQMALSLEVMQFMRGWLVTHITGSDRGYIEAFEAAGEA